MKEGVEEVNAGGIKQALKGTDQAKAIASTTIHGVKVGRRLASVYLTLTRHLMHTNTHAYGNASTQHSQTGSLPIFEKKQK